MVNADGVEQAGGALHPSDPPAEAVPLLGRPVVQGVAPQLALLREVVRRHARHPAGPPRLVQQELPPLAPHVGAVQGHIDGQIPDDPHPQAVGVVLQGLPLGEEPELHRLVKSDILRQLLPGGRQRRRVVVQEVLVRPVEPGRLAEAGLERPVQGVLPQPGIGGGKVPHGLGLRSAQPGEGPPQQCLPALIEGGVVDGRSLRHPGGGQLRLRQQAPVPQVLQVDEQRVPGEGGLAGVGGVPRSGGPHRQHLPPPLPGVVEKFGKGPGLPAQGADAVRPRQGEHRQQDASGTLHISPSFLSDSVLLYAAGRRVSRAAVPPLHWEGNLPEGRPPWVALRQQAAPPGQVAGRGPDGVPSRSPVILA